MSAHMKARRTSTNKYIKLTVGIPGKQEKSYKIPNTITAKDSLNSFLKDLSAGQPEITPWDEAAPWEKLAEDRIAKYTEAGLALRGARYRAGLSQKKLAEKCGISQDNLSRMENGKRVIGEKTAKKLGRVLHVDYDIFFLKK